MGWMVWGLKLSRGKRFFCSPKRQTGSDAHPASYSLGTRIFFLGIKHLVLEDNDSPPSTAKVYYVQSYTCTPHVCLHGVDRQGKLYLFVANMCKACGLLVFVIC